MTVTIPDEFDTFVDELLVSGSYSSLGTIIRDGLILLHLKRLRAAALPQYMSAGQKSFLDDVLAYVLTREIPRAGAPKSAAFPAQFPTKMSAGNRTLSSDESYSAIADRKLPQIPCFQGLLTMF